MKNWLVIFLFLSVKFSEFNLTVDLWVSYWEFGFSIDINV